MRLMKRKNYQKRTNVETKASTFGSRKRKENYVTLVTNITYVWRYVYEKCYDTFYILVKPIFRKMSKLKPNRRNED